MLKGIDIWPTFDQFVRKLSKHSLFIMCVGFIVSAMYDFRLAIFPIMPQGIGLHAYTTWHYGGEMEKLHCR